MLKALSILSLALAGVGAAVVVALTRGESASVAPTGVLAFVAAIVTIVIVVRRAPQTGGRDVGIVSVVVLVAVVLAVVAAVGADGSGRLVAWASAVLLGLGAVGTIATIRRTSSPA